MFKQVVEVCQSIKLTDEESMEKIKEEEKPKTAQKPKRGRRKMPSISRTNVSTRLFNGSKMHIARMVKDYRFTDPNFNSEAAAVRHYVHIGIAAETATSDVRHSLQNTVVKTVCKIPSSKTRLKTVCGRS